MRLSIAMSQSGLDHRWSDNCQIVGNDRLELPHRPLLYAGDNPVF